MGFFTDKTLMITGGTGSFGNAVLKRFLDTDIKEIRIFSRDEKKQDDMRKLYNNTKIKFYIGDVRDIRSVQDAMHGVDFIFSAAALKQVPSCEFFPMEAVRTNIIGTDNVLTAAIQADVQKAPACTIGVLAQAVRELFHDTNEIHYIGTRHGEKKYETLLTREECMHAFDLGNFYRVPADNRDLNYEQYYEKGQVEKAKLEEFTSDNTTILNVEQVKEKLLSLEYVRNELENM